MRLRFTLFLSIAWPPIATPAQTLEPVAVQGPSARVIETEPTSAYQRQSSEPTIELPSSSESEEKETSRRPQFGRKRNSKTDSPPSERSSAMLEGWAKSSGATAAAALAFVVGLFMLLAWAVKRGMPQSAQILPTDAIRILGRIPLGSRQFGHLLHMGNKLVLVSINQAGVEKLAEIDDPQEVLRLVALCSKSSSKSSQKQFEEIFGQFAKEKTESGFLGSQTSTGGQK